MKKLIPILYLIFVTSIVLANDFTNLTTAPKSMILSIADMNPCLANTFDDCTASQNFKATIEEASVCGVALLNWSIAKNGVTLAKGDGDNFEYRIDLATAYDITFIARNTCGQQTEMTETYTFWDCQEPDLLLEEKIEKFWYEDNIIELRPEDFLLAHYDNCSYPTKITYKIMLGGKTVSNDPTVIRQLPDVLTLDCSFAGNQSVHFIAIDEADNIKVRPVEAMLEDLGGACLVLPSIVLGSVETPNGVGIEGVAIALTGDVNSQIQSDETGHFGFFIEPEMTFNISLNKTDELKNGLSTFDLILIKQHILGIRPFNTPFQYLAADVNISGTITAYDIILASKVVLGMESELPTVQPWRFIQKNFDYDVNPAASNIPTVWSMQESSLEDGQLKFIGIKVGDINGTADISGFQTFNDRNNNNHQLYLKDEWLESGTTYTVPFNVATNQTLEGFQLSILTDKLQIKAINEQPVGIGAFGVDDTHNWTAPNEQQININWISSLTNPTGDFKLTFEAKTDGYLSEYLTLNQRNFTNEVYTAALDKGDIQLMYEDIILPISSFETKIYPNPIQLESTRLFIDNAPATTLFVDIHNSNGQLVKSYRENISKGNYQQTLVVPDVPGTYWVQIYTAEGMIKQQKLVKL